MDDIERLTRAFREGHLSADEYASLVANKAESQDTTGTQSKSSQPITRKVGLPHAPSPESSWIEPTAITAGFLVPLGVWLPWASVFGVSINGGASWQGKVIAVSGLASLGFLIGGRFTRVTALCCSLVTLALGSYFFGTLLIGTKTEFFGEDIRVSITPGIGLWLIVAGSIASILAHGNYLKNSVQTTVMTGGVTGKAQYPREY